MSRVVGVTMAVPLMILGACTAPAEPEDRSSAATSPTSTMSPERRLEEALEALHQSDPVQVVYVLSESSAKVIDTRGSWDPRTKAASVRVSFSDPFGSGRQTQGHVSVVKGRWYRASGRGCWVRTAPARLADWLRISTDTLGLGTALLDGATATRVSPASPDVLEVDFQLKDLMSVLPLQDSDPTANANVPGEVTLVDGRVAGWALDGEALGQGAGGHATSKLVDTLSAYDLDMEIAHGRTKTIQKPTPDELTRDPGTPCAAAGPSQRA